MFRVCHSNPTQNIYVWNLMSNKFIMTVRLLSPKIGNVALILFYTGYFYTLFYMGWIKGDLPFPLAPY